MPNIIINNYCNQSCSYCFASENMKDTSLQKNMSLSTYLCILKYLRHIDDENVRILWWEPIIFPHLRKFIDIAEKWWFNIIVFSNINIDPKKFAKIFSGVSRVRVNCNINDESFYSEKEKKQIEENLSFLQEHKIHTILWYNITDTNIYPEYHIQLANTYGIKDINLKVTNTCLWEKELLIDTNTRAFWKYLYTFIKKHYKEYRIELSCGINKNIFSKEERILIEDTAKIKILYWCEGHRGKFDINTDGNIFKCYPLESLYKKNPISIKKLVANKTSLAQTLDTLYKWVYSDGHCTAHKVILWEHTLW